MYGGIRHPSKHTQEGTPTRQIPFLSAPVAISCLISGAVVLGCFFLKHKTLKKRFIHAKAHEHGGGNTELVKMQSTVAVHDDDLN